MDHSRAVRLVRTLNLITPTLGRREGGDISGAPGIFQIPSQGACHHAQPGPYGAVGLACLLLPPSARWDFGCAAQPGPAQKLLSQALPLPLRQTIIFPADLLDPRRKGLPFPSSQTTLPGCVWETGLGPYPPFQDLTFPLPPDINRGNSPEGCHRLAQPHGADQWCLPGLPPTLTLMPDRLGPRLAADR